MNERFSDKDYLTVADIHSWLNISQAAAYSLTHRKGLPVAHLGGAIRIPREPFLHWVAVNTSNPMHYGESSEVA